MGNAESLNTILDRVEHNHRLLHGLATKEDLQAMEQRITEAIRHELSAHDQALLGGLLKRSARIARRLKALDAMTP